ncbi:hypothetical protein A9Q84_08650 [Halobacteriovorax marinus]|uniref:Solute-binding protein family 3/N-terminal domain-containing protein n=1 Tax=Halobacteriovorax marinus TaxID=97084 RepID=A0A1Y5FA87_9BACT|nr:hypothetical protein A9Q84_08650 [Halobacteriovorax marinus]
MNFSIFFLSVFLCFNTFAKKVTIATLEWPPYISEKIEGHGSVARIVTMAFKSVGYEVQFEFLPWARALSYVERGKVDAIVPIYKTIEREKKLHFSSSSFQSSPLVLYKRKDANVQIGKQIDLLNYKLGLVNGYNNTEFIDTNKKISKSYSRDDFINLKKLLRNRIDVISIDREVARYLISKNKTKFQDHLSLISPALDIKKLFLGISKNTSKSKKTFNDFNTGLKKIEHLIPQLINDSFSELGM